MSLDKAMKNLKYDSRLLEHNLTTGIISKEEYDKFMKQLPDLSNQSEKLEIDEKRSSSNGAGDSH
jgi:hypothetical protein